MTTATSLINPKGLAAIAAIAAIIALAATPAVKQIAASTAPLVVETSSVVERFSDRYSDVGSLPTYLGSTTSLTAPPATPNEEELRLLLAPALEYAS